MKASRATIYLLISCIILAVLLLTYVISATISGIIFAVMIIAFGLTLKGFRNK